MKEGGQGGTDRGQKGESWSKEWREGLKKGGFGWSQGEGGWDRDGEE